MTGLDVSGGVICISSSPQSWTGRGLGRRLHSLQSLSYWICDSNTKPSPPLRLHQKFIINIRKCDLLSFCSNQPMLLDSVPRWLLSQVLACAGIFVTWQGPAQSSVSQPLGIQEQNWLKSLKLDEIGKLAKIVGNWTSLIIYNLRGRN